MVVEDTAVPTFLVDLLSDSLGYPSLCCILYLCHRVLYHYHPQCLPRYIFTIESKHSCYPDCRAVTEIVKRRVLIAPIQPVEDTLKQLPQLSTRLSCPSWPQYFATMSLLRAPRYILPVCSQWLLVI